MMSAIVWLVILQRPQIRSMTYRWIQMHPFEKGWRVIVKHQKIYYYDGVTNTVLKYYKAFFDEYLCKSVRESEPFLDIEKVDDVAEEVIRELKILR